MAKFIEGEAQGNHRRSTSNIPRLPPRMPSIPSRSLPLADLGTGFSSSQGFGNVGNNQAQHKRTPSCNTVMHEKLVWLDELPEHSKGLTKRGSHRRSASDSFTYLENSVSINEMECSKSLLHETTHADGDKLTDLLKEIRQSQEQRNLPISAWNQPVTSRCESSDAAEVGTLSTLPGNTFMSKKDGLPGKPVFEPDVGSFEAADMGPLGIMNGDSMSLTGPADVNLDPKKTKRQSAQRSRVRKLQYIADLERIVNALQTQVSYLSPQLLFFEHQWTLLNTDNNSLKRKIAVCALEKSTTDAQNETLGNEIQRLLNVNKLQALHEPHKHKLQERHIQRHSSLPSDFGGQMHQFRDFAENFQRTQFDIPLTDSLSELPGTSLGKNLNSNT